jgi:hypothetical protein
MSWNNISAETRKERAAADEQLIGELQLQLAIWVSAVVLR